MSLTPLHILRQIYWLTNYSTDKPNLVSDLMIKHHKVCCLELCFSEDTRTHICKPTQRRVLWVSTGRRGSMKSRCTHLPNLNKASLGTCMLSKGIGWSKSCRWAQNGASTEHISIIETSMWVFLSACFPPAAQRSLFQFQLSNLHRLSSTITHFTG